MTMFSKRHYQAIALIMQDMHKQAAADSILSETDLAFHVCEEFAALFAKDNSLFKRGLFLQACIPGRNVRERTVKLTPQQIHRDRGGYI